MSVLRRRDSNGDSGGDADNEPLRRPRWWAWVAGLLAVIFMLYETGSWILTGLCFAALAGLVIYHSSGRGRASRFKMTGRGKTAARYCLKCGEALNPNARECRACGSAAWSFKN
jgi:ribosomal protein L40E